MAATSSSSRCRGSEVGSSCREKTGAGELDDFTFLLYITCDIRNAEPPAETEHKGDVRCTLSGLLGVWKTEVRVPR